MTRTALKLVKALTPALLALLLLAPAGATLASCGGGAGGGSSDEAPADGSSREAPAAGSGAGATALGAAAYVDVTPAHSDLAYAAVSPAQKLDIYLPAQGEPPYPVIIAIHGGGFISGDKADGQVTPVLAGLARGYAVVAVNYRLSDEARFPAAIRDVKAAIRWLRANAARYRLDPARFAAWGHSAGGTLAALAGTSGGVAALAGPEAADAGPGDAGLSNAGRSDRLQAVVDWYGPISFLRTDADFRASGLGRTDHIDARSFLSQYLGAALPSVPGRVRAADPTTYLSADDPPFFIEHGSADGTVPVQQSERFAAAVSRTLGPGGVTLRILPGAGHVDPAFMTAENLDLVLDWLDERLK